MARSLLKRSQKLEDGLRISPSLQYQLYQIAQLLLTIHSYPYHLKQRHYHPLHFLANDHHIVPHLRTGRLARISLPLHDFKLSKVSKTPILKIYLVQLSLLGSLLLMVSQWITLTSLISITFFNECLNSCHSSTYFHP